MGINISLRGIIMIGLLCIGLYGFITCYLLGLTDGFRVSQEARVNRIEMVFDK